MIRWILGIILVIVLIIAIVLLFRRFTSGSDDGAETGVPTEVANNGENSSQAPNVVSDSFATSAGQPVSGNVLSNDTDPQNDPLTVDTIPANGPTNGTLQLNADGNFVYTPGAGYVGVDSYDYRVCDPGGNCAIGMAQITINSAEDSGSGDTGTGSEQPTDNGTTGTDDGGDTTNTGNTTDSTNSDTGSTDSGSTSNTDTSTNNSTNTTTDSGNTTNSGGGATNAPSNTTGQPITDPATHVVKQGEWLIQIARCYGTSPETIRSQNYIPYPGWIMPGESLTISGIGSVSEAFLEPCIMFYTVQQGDTLYSIAQTYQVDLDMLLKANYGCYGYGYYYYPPVPTPYDGQAEAQPHYDGRWYMYPWYGYGPGYGAHSPYIYNGCYFPSYYNPVIYVGQELIIPVNLENADMRPAPTPTE